MLTLALLAAWLAYAAPRWPGGVTTRVDTLPPGGFLVLAPALAAIVIVLVALGRQRFRGVLDAMLLPALLLAQAFRVPVEIVPAMLAEAGLMPRIMTYHGTNFDILTGITADRRLGRGAPACGSRTVLAWNIAGLARAERGRHLHSRLFRPDQPPQGHPARRLRHDLSDGVAAGLLVPVAMLLHGLAIMNCAGGAALQARRSTRWEIGAGCPLGAPLGGHDEGGCSAGPRQNHTTTAAPMAAAM